MNNNELPTNLQDAIVPTHQLSDDTENDSSMAKTIGTVGGGVAGAALGHLLIGGKLGTAVGLVAGAVGGGVTGDKLSESRLNNERVDLPAHYSWDELQALSKPQI